MMISVLSAEFLVRNAGLRGSPPLSPKAKYVLARFALCFQGQTCQHDRSELAALMGISKGRLSDSLHELVERGLVVVLPQRGKRGRPSNHYSLALSVWQCLQSAQNSDMAAGDRHWRAIERVMTAAPAAAASMEQGKGAESLPLESRLLLCALLCHADRYGVVRRLSATDLYRLTGLKSDALKDRLQGLVDLELIRAWIPGVTSHALFGKAKSVYYLNLQHPTFGSLYLLAGIMISGWRYRWQEALILHSRLVDGWKNIVSRSHLSVRAENSDVPLQGMDDESVEKLIAGIGTQAENSRIVPMLQSRLEIYASWLLSYRWDELGYSLPCPKALDEIIRRDFVEVRQKEKAEVFRVADILVDHIYSHARSLACDTRKCFLRIRISDGQSPIIYQQHDYLILPHDSSLKRWASREDDQWARTVLIFSKGDYLSHGCHVFGHWYANEAEIPLSKRYFYGLLTKPSGKAGVRAEP